MSKRTYRIKIKDGYCVDDVYESPVDKYQVRFRRRIIWLAVIVVAMCIAWYCLHLWKHLK